MIRHYLILILYFSLTFVSLCISASSLPSFIDHQRPELGTYELSFQFSRAFDPTLPIVIVIADGQQFYVREGAISSLHVELFPGNVNVVGLFPRGQNPALLELVGSSPVDWGQAYQLFNVRQYVEDIHVLVEYLSHYDVPLYLYGQSGGANLVLEYLSRYPHSKVGRVFIAAAVNSLLGSHLGLVHDNFEQDFLTRHPALREQLFRYLNKRPSQRSHIARLLQRQNFFESLAELEGARVELLHAILNEDNTKITEYSSTYQVDRIDQLLELEAGIPIRVRIFEFFRPFSTFMADDKFLPELENSLDIATPLLKAGIPFDKYNYISNYIHGLRRVEADILILAAEHDHVADYRTSIYLHGILPNSSLILVEDDHTFKGMKSSKAYSGLIQCFFGTHSQLWKLLNKQC